MRPTVLLLGLLLIASAAAQPGPAPGHGSASEYAIHYVEAQVQEASDDPVGYVEDHASQQAAEEEVAHAAYMGCWAADDVGVEHEACDPYYTPRGRADPEQPPEPMPEPPAPANDTLHATEDFVEEAHTIAEDVLADPTNPGHLERAAAAVTAFLQRVGGGVTAAVDDLLGGLESLGASMFAGIAGVGTAAATGLASGLGAIGTGMQQLGAAIGAGAAAATSASLDGLAAAAKAVGGAATSLGATLADAAKATGDGIVAAGEAVRDGIVAAAQSIADTVGGWFGADAEPAQALPELGAPAPQEALDDVTGLLDRL